MKKRHIKSIAHWSIMTLLLLFPVLMVGISAFAHDENNTIIEYPYETNDVSNANDLVIGNIYKLHLTPSYNMRLDDTNCAIIPSTIKVNNGVAYTLRYVDNDGTQSYIRNFSDGIYIAQLNVVDSNSKLNFSYSASNYDVEFCFIYGATSTVSFNQFSFSRSDYLGYPLIIDERASYKQEVNNWANGFKNLPVNQWYGSLLDTIGIGQTNNSVMNVIYVYPLYVLWVYVLDLIVDCLLLIINFGHDALHRLGADNE